MNRRGWHRWTSVGIVMAFAVTLAAPASASNNTVAILASPPNSSTQTIAVTMADTAGATVYATYRLVDAANPPDPGTACVPAYESNTATVLFGPVLSTGTVYQAIALPFGMYAFCLYEASPGQAIRFSSAVVLGSVASAPAPVTRRTTISLGVSRTGTRVMVWGRAGGRATGTVAVQRRTATRGYVTIALLPIRQYVYRSLVPAAAGQIIRVVLLASPAYAASRSGDIRVR